eukprot:TRINITY_DN6437_c0_g1_i1.p2 TRINITY_DN6437_c0_g1~~TRINITY_DN6437_c0_g1_i1.p2  ORF type:complete len:121 (+),score=4.23 TRINITY_DN6437_c0_g1_i1:178-540(+)
MKIFALISIFIMAVAGQDGIGLPSAPCPNCDCCGDPDNWPQECSQCCQDILPVITCPSLDGIGLPSVPCPNCNCCAASDSWSQECSQCCPNALPGKGPIENCDRESTQQWGTTSDRKAHV